jgi:hypothetical protein
MWCRVDLLGTDVSEESIVSIFGVEKSVSEEPTWAGDCRQDLHSATSQKTPFFIVTAVKTSNLTCCFFASYRYGQCYRRFVGTFCLHSLGRSEWDGLVCMSTLVWVQQQNQGGKAWCWFTPIGTVDMETLSTLLLLSTWWVTAGVTRYRCFSGALCGAKKGR